MQTMIPTLVGFATMPWNKGRLIGQKRPLKPKEVWAIRVRLQLEGRKRDLALFNLAIDSKLRGCDLVLLRVDDVCVGGRMRDRATVIQKKTGRPVQFEITEQTRSSVRDWLSEFSMRSGQYLFPGRGRGQPHLSTWQLCAVRTRLDRERRARQLGLRHPFDAPHKGGPDRSQDRQFASGSAIAGAYEAGEHRSLSRGIEVDDALSIAEQVEL